VTKFIAPAVNTGRDWITVMSRTIDSLAGQVADLSPEVGHSMERLLHDARTALARHDKRTAGWSLAKAEWIAREGGRCRPCLARALDPVLLARDCGLELDAWQAAHS
jgi:hypothetical protein